MSGLHMRGRVASRVRAPRSVGRKHAGEVVLPQRGVSPCSARLLEWRHGGRLLTEGL